MKLKAWAVINKYQCSIFVEKKDAIRFKELSKSKQDKVVQVEIIIK